MSVRRPALALVVACAAALAVPSVASAAPPRVLCGATLTVDTVLRHDLTCAGDGLVLEPGVTLDLRGHTLRGSGTGVGVLVSSVGEIEVRNGTLTGWDKAVDILGVDDESLDTGPLAVDRVRFRDNATGVDASGEDGSGRYGKRTTITRSTFVGHTRYGVDSQWYGSVSIDGSTFTDNVTAVWNDGDGAVTRSRFVRNGTAVLVGDAPWTVDDCVFEDNARGVHGYAKSVLDVRRSRFVGSDVAVEGSAWLTVSSSTFVGNSRALVLGWLSNEVTGNVLRANGEAIVSDEESLWATIRDNTLRQNGEGIVLDPPASSSMHLGGNDVRGSAGHGIYVPSGAVDLGGNTARGNGIEPQCVGVVCVRS